jgi:hypothetical protein
VEGSVEKWCKECIFKGNRMWNELRLRRRVIELNKLLVNCVNVLKL